MCFNVVLNLKVMLAALGLLYSSETCDAGNGCCDEGFLCTEKWNGVHTLCVSDPKLISSRP